MNETKICKIDLGGCGKEKTLDHFYRELSGNGGYKSICKVCFAKRSKINYEKRKKTEKKLDPTKNKRYCAACETRKPIIAFSGSNSYCRKCTDSKRKYYTEDERPQCCGKVLPAYQLNSQGAPMHNKPQVWACMGCGKDLGYVDDQFTPAKMLAAIYNSTGERWDVLKSV